MTTETTEIVETTKTFEPINDPAAVEDLHITLAKEAEDYRLLVAATQRERTALVENSMDALNATVQEKETLTARLAQWAEKREQLTAFLAGCLGLPATVTLTDLVSHFEETIARQLLALRDEFITLVEQLIILNHGNQLLLQSELVRIETTFDYITTSVTKPVANYTVNGSQIRPTSQAGSNFLNRQA